MNASLFTEIVDKYFKLVVGRIVEKFNGKKEEQTLLHKTMLTEEYSADLTWGSTEINHSIVAADVVSLDSSLPLKSRGTISHATGKLPKLGVKYRKGEEDITNINIMSARGTDEATVAAKIFDDSAKCIKSMDVRKEIMFLQGLSTGMTLIPSNETDGTGVRVKFGYKEENTFHAKTAAWGETGYDPIEDIRQMFDKAGEDSNTINLVLISKKYFNLIRASESGKKLVADYRGQVVVSTANLSQPGREAMLEALADEFGATFRIVDSTFKLEEHDGSTTPIRPWVDANIVGVPEETVGRLVYGTLAEETNPVANVAYQKAGTHVLLSKYSKTDPLEEFTAAQALCLPVIDGADSIYILHANDTDTVISVDDSTMSFEVAGGQQTTAVHYEGEISDVTLASSQTWARANRRGNTITVTVEANSSAQQRTASITVSASGQSATIVLTQAGE